MKMIFNISDETVRQLESEAARRGLTMSELVETAIETLLDKHEPAAARDLPPLPTFNSGGARVNIADREALYGVMERS